MPTVAMSITIDRSVDDVFAVLTDVTRTADWSSSAESERWLTEPPHGLGSRREAVGRTLGRRITNVAEVTAFEPLRGWTMRSVSGPAFEASAVFSPEGAGTRVDWTWSFGRSRLARLAMTPLMPVFRRRFVTDLGRLKAMMERREL